MLLYIFFSIAILSLFTTIVLALFFWVTRKGEKLANRLMVVLLFLFGLQIIYSFTISNFAYQFFMSWHKGLYLLRQSSLLTGPVIYLYFRAFLKNEQLKPIHLLHAIPFVGALTILCFYLPTVSNFVIWKSETNFYNTVFILGQNLIYILLTLKYFKSLNYSIASIFKNLKASSYSGWLQLFLLGFIVLWILNLYMFATYMILKKTEWCAFTGSIFALALFLFLNSIIFILLLKPEIYFLVEKYKKTPVSEDIKKMHLNALTNYMVTKKPYLMPEIAIDDVAKELSVSNRLLSQIINESFQNNFNGYLNDFRIKESIRQLSDIGNKKTVLEILFESGFNSKSVFYTEFKKRTNLTPQEFRTTNNKREFACS